MKKVIDFLRWKVDHNLPARVDFHQRRISLVYTLKENLYHLELNLEIGESLTEHLDAIKATIEHIPE